MIKRIPAWILDRTITVGTAEGTMHAFAARNGGTVLIPEFTEKIRPKKIVGQM